MIVEFIKKYKALIVLGSIVLVAFFIYVLPSSSSDSSDVSLTPGKFYDLLKSNNIVSAVRYVDKFDDGTSKLVTLEGVRVTDNGLQRENFTVNLLTDNPQYALVEAMDDLVIRYNKKGFWGPFFSGISGGPFIYVLPMAALVGYMIWAAKRVNNQNMDAAKKIGKSSATSGKVQSLPKVSFDDVAGLQEAKESLQEVVEFLKYPEHFTAFGAKIPKGVLLMGPPGCGKTLLAKAVAGEARVPFLAMSGSEFVELFIGVGASRVRDLFTEARRCAPSIIFIDEIDAVGRHRGTGLGGGNDEREQTLNQILVEMQGFDERTNVIVIAATNRPDILDPALTRPGRFDRKVIIDEPDREGREQILAVHAKGKPMAEDVDLGQLAGETFGLSGADLANGINEGALVAAREYNAAHKDKLKAGKKIGVAIKREKPLITMENLLLGMEIATIGPAQKSKKLSEREKEIVAYHEMGHALTGHVLLDADPPTKVSCLRHGQALGFTRFVSEEDRNLWDKGQLFAQIIAALGGRAAEELHFGKVTTGASNDIEKATNIAREMVTKYGMSSKIGLVNVSTGHSQPFLGRDITEGSHLSGETAFRVDEAVHALINEAYKIAQEILAENEQVLTEAAELLMEKDALDAKDFLPVFAGAKQREKPEDIEDI